MTYYIFYDLDNAPTSFNVFHTLLAGEIARKHIAPASSAHVVFVPGFHHGFKEHGQMSVDQRWWRARSILFPAVDLLPSCSGYTILPEREAVQDMLNIAGDKVFPLNYSEANAAATARHSTLSLNYGLGYDMPSIRAPKIARDYVERVLKSRCPGKTVVAISLRGADYSVERNSQLGVWREVINYLVDRHIHVFLLPEYEDIFEQETLSGEGIEVFKEGVLNLQLRLALFERVDLLIGQGGGAMMPAIVSPNTNYVCVRAHVEEFPGTTELKLREQGLLIGKNPNYFGNYVKWIWSEEYSDQIISAIERYIDAFSPGRQNDDPDRATRLDILEALSDYIGFDTIQTLLKDYGPNKKGPVFINRERQSSGNYEYALRAFA